MVWQDGLVCSQDKAVSQVFFGMLSSGISMLKFYCKLTGRGARLLWRGWSRNKDVVRCGSSIQFFVALKKPPSIQETKDNKLLGTRRRRDGTGYKSLKDQQAMFRKDSPYAIYHLHSPHISHKQTPPPKS